MATLKSRLDQLEAKAPTDDNINSCLVVHSKDCGKDREAAAAAYLAEHGSEPTKFVHVFLVSAQTKQIVCGCARPSH